MAEREPYKSKLIDEDGNRIIPPRSARRGSMRKDIKGARRRSMRFYLARAEQILALVTVGAITSKEGTARMNMLKVAAEMFLSTKELDAAGLGEAVDVTPEQGVPDFLDRASALGEENRIAAEGMDEIMLQIADQSEPVN